VLLAGAVAGATLLPLAYLVYHTATVGPQVGALLLQPRTAEVLANSVILAAVVTGASLLLAVPLAFLTIRTDLPARRFWSLATALPLAVPSYVGAFAYLATLAPRGSLLQLALAPWGVERLPSLYGWPGTVLVLTLFTYPYVLLTVRAALRGLDPGLEEVARTLGYGPREAFFKLTLPHLRPAMAAGGLLVALYTLSDFGTPSLLRFDSFTRVIYVQYLTLDRSLAAVLALLLVAVAAAVLFLEYRVQGRFRYYRTGAGAQRQPGLVALGPWRWPALALCALVVTLALLLPLAVVGYWFVRGTLAGVTVLPVWDLALNALFVSGLAAVFVVLAAFPVAYLVVRYPGPLSHLAERSTYLGFAMPGVVVALALVFFGANFATPLYQTLLMLLFAYMVLFIPQAVGAIRSALLQLNPNLEEASRLLGRGTWATLRAVTVPLARSGLLTGAALIFLTTIRELPATLLLSPIGFGTLATRVWSATEEALFAQAAVPALLLVALSALTMGIILHQEERGILGGGAT
jgi:iron(III) transport system permease protein